jgi:zinc transport system ATP-binding protein
MESDDAAAVVTLRGAAFGYGDRAVLTDVDLTIRSGEIVAIIGPNGSGKSTLMKGVLGLNERVAGTVTLFGVDSNDFHDRARLGYVPQRHTLSASVRATAEEIVATGRLSRIGWLGRLRATDRQIVARSLEVVGLADRAATEVSTLSGGQQRRVLIARALAGQPDVLIMDEPTAGVDAANQHVLADVLARLVERDVTMVIVTHELGALERLLTRIVVIDAGRIRFDGTPQEYARARERVHHDHDSHHHDLELDRQRPSVGPGPLDATHADGGRP